MFFKRSARSTRSDASAKLKEYKTIVVVVNPMNFNEFSNSASAEGASHKRAVRKGCYMMHVTVI
jgi:hypothetical protein